MRAMPTDAVGKHILRLLSLHKDLQRKFSHVDLNAMDAAAKQALLDDINRSLQIR
jgi:hypothetical protein